MFTYLVELANRMSKEMEVVIAYSVRKQTPKDFRNYFNHQIKLIEVKNFTRNVSLIRDIKAILEVKKIVKSEKPDFVHMHSSKAGAIGRLAISPKQAKLFYTPHSYAFCKKDETGIKVLFYKMAEKLLGKRRCLTIACSKGEYEASRQVTKKSVCISNGIDIEEMNEIILDEPERMVDGGNLRVCTVGRIGPQKNPKLFNQIAENFPNLSFMWIGDGELKCELKSPNIQITGWKAREDTIKKLYQNDIFILPSLWEGLPITLLEAMYLRKLCLVSDVMGNRDVIHHGMDGFICEKEEDYYNLIEKIKNAEVDYLKIKDKARQTVLANHNMDDVEKEYKRIYCEGVDYH